ncbi:FCD domain-containing protein [Arthrobacter gengyunqii]|uniref:FCD domain-containing protein n=1 Tax=Arthrobacter gengyunqii TaxID=2886940 RepID=A0A9X1LZ68_9MICC|nr:FCD domain-containing protein [Arthrobacter gengyunqii]MCC3268081.1 FCD domain-containing protein [Arthrobacter gengyunqii]UOY95499.1 FCD domain-containing protein [Arthrobacter gengyunqii]
MNDIPPPATTRSAVIFDALRADILGGFFEPGSRLQFTKLVERYQCSIGSLREALQRLSEVGLAESIAQQGFRVIAVSNEDLRDLVEARMEIEVTVLRHAIRHGDISWEGSCIAALHMLDRTPRHVGSSDFLSESWTIAHATFHQTLLEGCPNGRLLGVAARLRDVAELYRHWTTTHDDDLNGAANAEHHAILDAALARDAEQAGNLLRAHIERAHAPLRPRAAQLGGAIQ